MIDQHLIREALLADAITWREALVATTGRGGKPWQTAEWRRRRKALIGDHCTQCGSRKPPMVVQHLWHPRPYHQVYTTLLRAQEAVYMGLNPIPSPTLPLTLRGFTPAQRCAIRAQSRALWATWHQRFLATCGNEVAKRAVLVTMDEHERYLSFRDATTFCAKCAFLWDVKLMKLCGFCRSHYHARYRSACRHCAIHS